MLGVFICNWLFNRVFLRHQNKLHLILSPSRSSSTRWAYSRERRQPKQGKKWVWQKKTFSSINYHQSKCLRSRFRHSAYFRSPTNSCLSTQLASFIGQSLKPSISLGWSSAIKWFTSPSRHSFGRRSWLTRRWVEHHSSQRNFYQRIFLGSSDGRRRNFSYRLDPRFAQQ